MIKYLIFIIILTTFNCFAKDKETKYNYMGKIFLKIPALHATIKDKNDNYNLDYSPNVNAQIGLGASIYDFGASFSLNIPQTQERINDYGKTNYFDFQLYYVNKHFGIDFYLQSYQGFYLEDKDKRIIRDDIILGRLGINSYYIFNDKFFLKAGIDQTIKQKTSEFSWLMLSSLEFSLLYSPNNIIPDIYNKNDEFYYLGGRYYSFSITPGFGYISNNDGFFFTGIIFFGLGLQYRYNFFKEEVKEFGLSYKFDLKLSTGYNGKRFYTGIFAVFDTNDSILDKFDVGVNSINLELFFAYRF